jgi:2-oxoglutarate ferredoxin oxidoreductase subunit alpha
MEDINVVVAGAAGEGVQTVGDILVEVASQLGYAVFSWKEYESRIRGGHNRYSIRIGERPVNVPLVEADVLLALNQGAKEKYRHLVKKSGILIAEEADGNGEIAVPFTQTAKEKIGDAIYANAVATGALAAALGIGREPLYRHFEARFSGKSDHVVNQNHKAIDMGYELAESGCRDACPWTLPGADGAYAVLTGNEAIPLGAAYAGCRFVSAYPMTPATGVVTYLADRRDSLGVFVEQAEDEIAAVNMAIGAGFAGARAMTATSGGGFALMCEGISLAGMTETPLVIVLAQRPGPATGLPTRTAQGDLLFSVFAGHGEFSKIVLAPADPKSAFHATVRAFNLADRFQVPVIILTDQFMADSHYSIPDMAVAESSPVFYTADPGTIDDYARYRITETGISPRLYPGQSRHLVAVDSDAHDETGHITEDLRETVPAMNRKRAAKHAEIQKAVQPPETIDAESADILLVSWGSTRPVVKAALNLLKEDGKSVGMIHFTDLWPLPENPFPKGKRLIAVEQNSAGQLVQLLRTGMDAAFEGSIHRDDGLPLTAGDIREAFSW